MSIMNYKLTEVAKQCFRFDETNPQIPENICFIVMVIMNRIVRRFVYCLLAYITRIANEL